MVLGILKPLWAIKNTVLEINDAPELTKNFFNTQIVF